MKKIAAEDIDALLPQTQCGLCNYAGCMPYATALAKNEAPINLCPPGGVTGLLNLAELLDQDPEPYLKDMQTKPPARALIREAECIGCAKCIKACPVDAILGSGKLMHTILTDECTGCELCIAPCPVDCIEMIPSHDFTDRKKQYRERYQARMKRLRQDKEKITVVSAPLHTKHEYIKAALARVKQKKSGNLEDNSNVPSGR